MTTLDRAVLLSLTTAVLALPSSVAAAAGETVTAELARCATIAASQARLACYDALSGHRSANMPPVVEQAAVPSTPAAVLATPPPKATPQPAPPTPTDSAQNFGLSAAQLRTTPQGPPAIQAHVSELHEDQLRRSSVVLDNGQVWVSTEGEMLLNAGEAVTISRAALGSFMLTSASKHAYHVRRIR